MGQSAPSARQGDRCSWCRNTVEALRVWGMLFPALSPPLIPAQKQFSGTPTCLLSKVWSLSGCRKLQITCPGTRLRWVHLIRICWMNECKKNNPRSGLKKKKYSVSNKTKQTKQSQTAAWRDHTKVTEKPSQRPLSFKADPVSSGRALVKGEG